MLMYLEINSGILEGGTPIHSMTELHVIMQAIEKRIEDDSWDREDRDAKIMFPDGNVASLVHLRDDGHMIYESCLVPFWENNEAAFVQQCAKFLAPSSSYHDAKEKWESL